MAVKTIDDLSSKTSLESDDYLVMWSDGDDSTHKISGAHLTAVDGTTRGGLAEKGETNTFTVAQTFEKDITVQEDITVGECLTVAEDITLAGVLKSDVPLAIQHTNFSGDLDGQLKIRGTVANSIATVGFNCLIDTADAGVFRNLGYVDFSLDNGGAGLDMQTSTRFATIVAGVEAERLIIDRNVLVKDTISTVLDGEFKIRGHVVDAIARMGYSVGIAVSSNPLLDMGYIDFALDDGTSLKTSIRFATVLGGTKTETLILDKVGNLEITQAALIMHEMSAPGTPAADSVVIYAEDDSAGKTRLMAKFSGGTAVQLAIDPA